MRYINPRFTYLLTYFQRLEIVFWLLFVEKGVADLLFSQFRVVANRRSLFGTFNALFSGWFVESDLTVEAFSVSVDVFPVTDVC